MAAKAQVRAYGNVYVGLSCDVRNVVQIAVGVGVFEVDSGRNYARFYNLPVDIARNNYAFRFKELLERHVRDVQRVEEYARMLGISRVTLNDAVKSQFGVSASHLMKQRLLEDLKNELLFSDNNISQLADDFRFSDPSHLMRFFKQHTGKTLLQYKQDYMNGIYE